MKWFAALLALTLALPAAAQQTDFPLVPAEALSATGDVLVTVPLLEERLEPDYAEGFAARYGAVLLAVWPLRSTEVLCLVLEAPGPDAADMLAALRADPEVRTAEPIRSYRTTADPPQDPLVPIQDAFHAMNVAAAHARSTGAGVRVAVIDTGVETGHPDLASRAVTYADMVRAFPVSEVAERHGTAVAALIAADPANGLGIAGVAPDAEILALRACWEEADGAGACNSFTLARALNVAILRDAHVINMSLEGPPDPLLEELVETALAQGRTVVAADSGAGAFPAAVPGVIAAGDGAGALAAPQTDVIAAVPGAGYDFFSGSSVAAAHVSGVVALMRAAPGGGDLRARMDAAAEGGPLDACRALAACQ